MLVQRAASQRIVLAEIHASLEGPISWLRTGLHIAGSIRAHRNLAGISALGILLAFGRRSSQARIWLARGLAVYQAGSLVRSLLRPRDSAGGE